MNKLQNGDLSKLKIVGVGDSHMVGQGEDLTTNYGSSAPELQPPTGVTDLYHKKSVGSGKFFDRFARFMAINYGLGVSRRIAPTTEETHYHSYFGTWSKGVDSRMPENQNVVAAQIPEDYVIKRIDPNKGYYQRCIGFRFAKVSSGGILKIYVRTNNPLGVTGLKRDAVWKKPSEILGIVRSDDVVGSLLDTIDLYSAITDYTYNLFYSFPYQANWEIKMVVSAEKNTLSSGKNCLIGPTIIETPHFINAGRGNHTTLDYLGHAVSVGAGGSGNFNHTDHLNEVLNLEPSLILLEPMIINDWLYGCNLVDTKTNLQEVIRRIKFKNCDVICMTPAPVITTDLKFDYCNNPYFLTMPPLENNLNGLGKYEDYKNVVITVCASEQTIVVNSYQAFIKDYESANHVNWTIGDTAGRIHVNQRGHDIYFNSLVSESGLFCIGGIHGINPTTT